MNAEIVTALVGFGGAVVGAGASMGAAWLTQRHQARQADVIRLRELGRLATDTALSELIKLHDLLDSTLPPRDQTRQEQPWEQEAKRHLRNVELALLRIPEDGVYARVAPTLHLAREYRWAGPRHWHYIRMMRRMVEDMVTALSAHIRSDELPPPHRYVSEARQTVDERKDAAARAFLDEPEPDYEPDDAP
ncbi:hypothetical protein ACFWA6_27550 [Streptomyces sp. NPDC060020]|uniref:hypothetical protein n=1 Tax=Streptomyces sp. NPDC060020 TaxID=3347038 RepID=UPI00369537A3